MDNKDNQQDLKTVLSGFDKCLLSEITKVMKIQNDCQCTKRVFTVKLGYNDHGYSEFTTLPNKICRIT